MSNISAMPHNHVHHVLTHVRCAAAPNASQVVMAQSFNPDNTGKPQRHRVSVPVELHPGDTLDFVTQARKNHDCDGVFLIDVQVPLLLHCMLSVWLMSDLRPRGPLAACPWVAGICQDCYSYASQAWNAGGQAFLPSSGRTPFRPCYTVHGRGVRAH